MAAVQKPGKPGKNSRRTRARARSIEQCRTRGERVDYLLELMLDARFTWNTSREVAATWKVDRTTAQDYAAEARRAYMREVERAGGADHKARLFAAIEFVGRDALERREEVVDAMGDVHSLRRPDHRTARQCLRDLAELAGHLVHKHEVTVAELTDEEIRAQLLAHGLKVIETTAEPPALTEGETNVSGSDDTDG